MAAPHRSRRIWFSAVAVVLALGVAAVVTVVATTPDPEPPAPRATATPTPTPAPEPVGYPENTDTYDLAALPAVDVFSLAGDLAVDDSPTAEPLALVATPRAPGAPLFADPLAAPVGQLPSELRFDGTTVPVIELQDAWARVMISGRAGLPSEGRAGQLTAWVRLADVEIAETTISVRVSLSEPSITILDGDTVTYETGAFALGAAATPTPIGRTFVMTSRVDPNAGFTRGHPVVYLGLQSPTLDGFNGASTAITAFHYHDVRTGAVSNGCLRVDAEAIARLAALPLGTPVTIYP